jgi:hypothetical protein
LTGLPPRDKLLRLEKSQTGNTMVKIRSDDFSRYFSQGKEAHFMQKTFLQTPQIRTAVASGKDLLPWSAPVNW